MGKGKASPEQRSLKSMRYRYPIRMHLQETILFVESRCAESVFWRLLNALLSVVAKVSKKSDEGI
jgi:hypothetical protein